LHSCYGNDNRWRYDVQVVYTRMEVSKAEDRLLL
jgi:hypothetical protein